MQVEAEIAEIERVLKAQGKPIPAAPAPADAPKPVTTKNLMLQKLLEASRTGKLEEVRLSSVSPSFLCVMVFLSVFISIPTKRVHSLELDRGDDAGRCVMVVPSDEMHSPF
jgi:hypothetical protein